MRITEAGGETNFRKYGKEIFKQVETKESINPMFARARSPQNEIPTPVKGFVNAHSSFAAAPAFVSPEKEELMKANLNEAESRLIGRLHMPKKIGKP